jgi:hypothetical protein
VNAANEAENSMIGTNTVDDGKNPEHHVAFHKAKRFTSKLSFAYTQLLKETKPSRFAVSLN